MKSLDTSAKSLDASAKYFGRVGEILGPVGEILRRVGEIFWTRRRNPSMRRRNILDSLAAFWSPRRHKICRLGKDTASATPFLDGSAYNIYNITVASVRSLFGEMRFQDVVYISLDSMSAYSTPLSVCTLLLSVLRQQP